MKKIIKKRKLSVLTDIPDGYNPQMDHVSYYDEHGRLIKKEFYEGHYLWGTTKYEYDEHNRITHICNEGEMIFDFDDEYYQYDKDEEGNDVEYINREGFSTLNVYKDGSLIYSHVETDSGEENPIILTADQYEIDSEGLTKVWHHYSSDEGIQDGDEEEFTVEYSYFEDDATHKRRIAVRKEKDKEPSTTTNHITLDEQGRIIELRQEENGKTIFLETTEFDPNDDNYWNEVYEDRENGSSTTSKVILVEYW